MRVKWAPFCNLGGPFSRKGVQETGGLKGIWIGTFWATEKAWARITAEYRMFFWWNSESDEEEKGNWDSKRL